MNGKVLKVSESTLKFGNKDLEIVVFCCLKDLKYGNMYIIFANKNEYKDNILYYGKVHYKPDSIVILNIKQDMEKEILNIVEDLLSHKELKGYEFISIDKVLKAEIISKNKLELSMDKLIQLEEISIKKKEEIKENKIKNKKRRGLKIFLLLLILIMGLMVIFYLKNKTNYNLVCVNEYEEKDISAKVYDEVVVVFDKDNNLLYLDKTVKYKFDTKIEYEDFKSNNVIQNKYIKESDTVKYDDNNNTFIAFTRETNIHNSYKDMKDMYEAIEYTCTKNKNYE